MVVGHFVFVFVFVFCFCSIVAYDIIIGGVIAPWWLGSTTVEIPNQWQNADMIIAQLSTS